MLLRLIHWSYLVIGSGFVLAIARGMFSFILKPWRDDLDEAWKKVAKGHAEKWRERRFYLGMVRRHRRNRLLHSLSTDPAHLIQFLIWPIFFSFQALFAQYQSNSIPITFQSGPHVHHLLGVFFDVYPDAAYLLATCSWARTFYALARSRDKQYLEVRLNRTDQDIHKYAKLYRPSLLAELKERFEPSDQAEAK